MKEGALPESVREEEIRAAFVGELKPLDASIELAEYDPAWPELFQREEGRIRAALGERMLRLEHVGSTSVPGLAAKPIIDMCLVVSDSSDEKAYVPALEAAGYVLRIREPEWFEHRCFKGPDTNVNLHVYSEGCPEIERNLLFRDRLRTYRADRELYERTKRDLVTRKWKYVKNYADAKPEVIEEIIARTRANPHGGDRRNPLKELAGGTVAKDERQTGHSGAGVARDGTTRRCQVPRSAG